MRRMLDSLLPLDRIRADLREILSVGTIEIGNEKVAVDEGVGIELISRAFYANEVDVGFGESSYRALVAIGGIREVKHGVVKPGICFATLWYTGDRQFITADFSDAIA